MRVNFTDSPPGFKHVCYWKLQVPFCFWGGGNLPHRSLASPEELGTSDARAFLSPLGFLPLPFLLQGSSPWNELHTRTHTHVRFFLFVDRSLNFDLSDLRYPCHARITSPGITAGRHCRSQAGPPCSFVESRVLLEGLPTSGVVVPSSSSPRRSQQRSNITTFSLSFSLVNQTEGRSTLTSFVEWNVVSQGLLVVSKPWFSFYSLGQIDISTNRYWLYWETDMTVWRWTPRKEASLLILPWWQFCPHLCRSWAESHLT